MKWSFVIWGLFLSSCCANVDCATVSSFVKFEYLSEDGIDLLNCSGVPYSLEDFRLYALSHSKDTVFSQLSISQDCSTIFAELNPSINEYFLEVKKEVTDTLSVKYQWTESKCCSILEIEEIQLNESTQPLQEPLKIVEKK